MSANHYPPKVGIRKENPLGGSWIELDIPINDYFLTEGQTVAERVRETYDSDKDNFFAVKDDLDKGEDLAGEDSGLDSSEPSSAAPSIHNSTRSQASNMARYASIVFHTQDAHNYPRHWAV